MRDGRAQRRESREVFIHAGNIVLRARLLDTPTADRIWTSLPFYSTAEIWGGLVHFETHVETGCEPDARQTIALGEIAFWVEEDRVLIGFGMTPLSHPGEIRLPSSCNIWAKSLDDVRQLAPTRPGQRISILEAAS